MVDDGLPPLRDVVRDCGIEPNRALGQNFLFDLNLTARIARAAGPLAGLQVVEVGPGPGGLTRALLAEGASVVAIERDRRCLPALTAIAARYPGRLTIVEGDALDLLPGCLPERPAGAEPWPLKNESAKRARPKPALLPKVRNERFLWDTCSQHQHRNRYPVSPTSSQSVPARVG